MSNLTTIEEETHSPAYDYDYSDEDNDRSNYYTEYLDSSIDKPTDNYYIIGNILDELHQLTNLRENQTQTLSTILNLCLDDVIYYNSQPILTGLIKDIVPELTVPQIITVCQKSNIRLSPGVIHESYHDITIFVPIIKQFLQLPESYNQHLSSFHLLTSASSAYTCYHNNLPYMEEMYYIYVIFKSLLFACDDDIFFNILASTDSTYTNFLIYTYYYHDLMITQDILTSLSDIESHTIITYHHHEPTESANVQNSSFQDRYSGEGPLSIIISLSNHIKSLDERTNFSYALKDILDIQNYCLLNTDGKLYKLNLDAKNEYDAAFKIKTLRDELVPVSPVIDPLDYQGKHIKVSVFLSQLAIALNYFGYCKYLNLPSEILPYKDDFISLYNYYIQQNEYNQISENMYYGVKTVDFHDLYPPIWQIGPDEYDSRISFLFATKLTYSLMHVSRNHAYQTSYTTPTRVIDKTSSHQVSYYGDDNIRHQEKYYNMELEIHTRLEATYATEVTFTQQATGSWSYRDFISNRDNMYTFNTFNRSNRIYYNDVYFPLIKEILIPHKYLGIISVDDKLNHIFLNILLNFDNIALIHQQEITHSFADGDYYEQRQHLNEYNNYYGRYFGYKKINSYFLGTGHALYPTPIVFNDIQSDRAASKTISTMKRQPFYLGDSCFSKSDNGKTLIQPVCRTCGNNGTSQYIVRVCEILHCYTRDQHKANLANFEKYGNDYFDHLSYTTNKIPALRRMRTKESSFIRYDYNVNNGPRHFNTRSNFNLNHSNYPEDDGHDDYIEMATSRYNLFENNVAAQAEWYEPVLYSEEMKTHGDHDLLTFLILDNECYDGTNPVRYNTLNHLTEATIKIYHHKNNGK